MDDFVNTRMISHPLNWAILFFMVLIAAVLADLALRALETSHQIYAARNIVPKT